MVARCVRERSHARSRRDARAPVSGSVVLELTPVASAKKTRRRRLSLLLGISLALLVTSGAVYSALPLVRMRMAKATAMACLAGYDKPRGPKLPDCSAPIQEFSKLARVSYVHHDATYRAEELWARIMVAEYENASIGSPDPKVRNDTAKFVDDAETVLDKGSQRILLDELGQVIAAPHLGQLASSLGDRRTLVDHFDWWSQWSVRVHAIRAALVEGDLGKASQIAARITKTNSAYVEKVKAISKRPRRSFPK